MTDDALGATMALHEPVRSSIFRQFEELLGTEEAAALMAQFPDYDLAEVVTSEKLDLRLQETEQRIHAEMAEMKADLHHELHSELSPINQRLCVVETKIDVLAATLPDVVIKQLLFWLVPVILTAIGLSVTLAKLVGP